MTVQDDINAIMATEASIYSVRAAATPLLNTLINAVNALPNSGVRTKVVAALTPFVKQYNLLSPLVVNDLHGEVPKLSADFIMLLNTGIIASAGSSPVPTPVLNLSAATVTDAASVGDLIGTLLVTNGTGSYTFTLTSNPGTLFSISGSSLKVAAALTAGSDSITVHADNGSGSTVSRTFMITVTSGAQAWKVLKIGGGGFVSGASFNADGTKAVRCDSGGGYRWNASTSVWERYLTLSNMPSADASPSDVSLYLNGVYEICIAPSNSSRWYMTYIGYVFRSDDKGLTWTNITRGVAGAPAQLTGWDQIANDQNYRGNGPKMAVDPANADVVVVGTQVDGLWYTQDAGATWAKISTVTDSTTGGFLVCYDPSSSVVSGKTQGIYAGSYGHGIFHTATGPSGTWSAVTATGMPSTSQGMAVAANGTLFVVPDVNGRNLFRLAGGAAGTWSAIAVDPSSDIVRGIAVNPSNSNQVWVTGTISRISYSGDNGVTFSGYGTMSYSSPTVPWIATLSGAGEFPGGGTLFYDPATSQLYLGHGAGVAHTTPPTSATLVTWTDVSQGIEEIIGTRVIKPPGGKPILAGWDMGVFRSIAPGSYPATKGTTTNPDGISACWGLDFCPTDSNVIAARIEMSGIETSGKSTDGGQTWTLFSALGAREYLSDGNSGGDIACGSDPLNFVMLKCDNSTFNNRPFYTLDGGATWHPITISGVSATGPTGWSGDFKFRTQFLVSDRVAPDTFYLYNGGSTGSTGGVYKSTDKAVSWTLGKSGAFTAGGFAANRRLYSVPNNAGHLFFTNGVSGSQSNPAPQKSTDGGANFTALTTCGEVWAMGFGKAKPGGSGYPAIFIIGYVGGVFGVYRSDDTAATWNQVGGDFACPLSNFDLMVWITGDPDVYGNAYMAQFDTGFSFFG